MRKSLLLISLFVFAIFSSSLPAKPSYIQTMNWIKSQLVGYNTSICIEGSINRDNAFLNEKITNVTWNNNSMTIHRKWEKVRKGNNYENIEDCGFRITTIDLLKSNSASLNPQRTEGGVVVAYDLVLSSNDKFAMILSKSCDGRHEPITATYDYIVIMRHHDKKYLDRMVNAFNNIISIKQPGSHTF